MTPDPLCRGCEVSQIEFCAHFPGAPWPRGPRQPEEATASLPCCSNGACRSVALRLSARKVQRCLKVTRLLLEADPFEGQNSAEREMLGR